MRHEHEEEPYVGRVSDGGVVQEMKDCGPSESPCVGEASNRLKLRWLKTVVVSVEEKTRYERVRWGSGRRAQANHC